MLSCRWMGCSWLVALVAVLASGVAVRGDEPVLKFTETTVDLGEVTDESVLRHEFPFVNLSGQPVRLDFGYCHFCIEPSADRPVYEPGQGGRVVLELKTQGQRGPVQATATVSARGVRGSDVQLLLKAAVRPIAIVEPRTSNLMEVAQKRGAAAEVVVMGRKEGFRITGVETGSEWVTVKTGPAKQGVDGGAAYTVYDVEVHVEPGAPLGRLEAVVELRTNDDRVPVLRHKMGADIVGEVAATPSIVAAGPVAPGEAFTARFGLSGRGGGAVRVVSVGTEESSVAESLVLDVAPGAVEGESASVVVSGVAGGARSGSGEIVVVVRAAAGDGPVETVRVPVRLKVRGTGR